MRHKAKFLFLFVFYFSHLSYSATTPLAVSIIAPIQFPPSDFNITGARISALWGNHRDVYGIDIGGVGNITTQDFVGIGVSGLFNWTEGMTTIIGLQAAGILNRNNQKTTVVGLQVAAANMNNATSSVTGLQAGVVNIANHTNIYGFQIGVYNRALEVYGFQVGLVNKADVLHGIQIGLINFHHKGAIGVSPILNIGF